MNTGRVKWFNTFQSYGYIILFDGTEVYFHSTGVQNSGSIDLLNPGISVSFDLIETKGGMEAHNVEVLA